MKKINALLLVIFWLTFIFFNSHRPGNESSKISNEIIISAVESFSNIEATSIEMQEIISKYSFIIRKIAHFLEYFILALLLYNLFFVYNWNINILIISLIIIFCASTDEIHQLFIIGRNGELRDIIFDTSAGFFGLFFCNFYMRSSNENV